MYEKNKKKRNFSFVSSPVLLHRNRSPFFAAKEEKKNLWKSCETNDKLLKAKWKIYAATKKFLPFLLFLSSYPPFYSFPFYKKQYKKNLADWTAEEKEMTAAANM